MKKTCLLISALIFVNMIYISSALTFDLKESYSPNENMLGEIFGSVIEPVEKSQIELKRGDVRVPFNGDIAKLGDKEYFWGLAPQLENNYTLYIYNITTNVAGIVKKVDLIRNFSVKGNLTDYNIQPGFIVTNENFSVDVFLYEDFKRNVNVSLIGDKTLSPGENKLNFIIDDFVGENFIVINIGKYAMPAYILGKKNESRTSVNESSDISFNPVKIQRVVSSNEKPIYQIEVFNEGNETLNNVRILFNESYFFVVPKTISYIRDNQSSIVNVSFIGNGSFNGSIYFVGESFNVSLPVMINVSSTSVVSNVTNASGRTNYYCSELNGVVCSANEVCSQTTVVSLDGYCCKGKCSVPKSGSSGAWVGYLLGIIVLAGIGYLVFRYRKKSPGVQEIFKKKVDEAQKKMP